MSGAMCSNNTIHQTMENSNNIGHNNSNNVITIIKMLKSKKFNVENTSRLRIGVMA